MNKILNIFLRASIRENGIPFELKTKLRTYIWII